jgi:hypothetical protein
VYSTFVLRLLSPSTGTFAVVCATGVTKVRDFVVICFARGVFAVKRCQRQLGVI